MDVFHYTNVTYEAKLNIRANWSTNMWRREEENFVDDTSNPRCATFCCCSEWKKVFFVCLSVSRFEGRMKTGLDWIWREDLGEDKRKILVKLKERFRWNWREDLGETEDNLPPHLPTSILKLYPSLTKETSKLPKTSPRWFIYKHIKIAPCPET
jgi:hypothetical protein